MVEVLDKMNKEYDVIYDNRMKIAEWKRKKINIRASAWNDATGIADQKKDYVRSVVADLDENISKAEAEIEKAYNHIKLYEYGLNDE